MPTSGRDRLSRIATTFVRARSVSPWNTGLGNRQGEFIGLLQHRSSRRFLKFLAVVLAANHRS
jgi:hypothetical protein